MRSPLAHTPSLMSTPSESCQEKAMWPWSKLRKLLRLENQQCPPNHDQECQFSGPAFNVSNSARVNRRSGRHDTSSIQTLHRTGQTLGMATWLQDAVSFTRPHSYVLELDCNAQKGGDRPRFRHPEVRERKLVSWEAVSAPEDSVTACPEVSQPFYCRQIYLRWTMPANGC